MEKPTGGGASAARKPSSPGFGFLTVMTKTMKMKMVVVVVVRGRGRWRGRAKKRGPPTYQALDTYELIVFNSHLT